jgi:crossover junction endodeoxyribonuclease RuvC
MLSAAIRIIGIDPGLRRTGWGIIDVSGTRLTFVACGTVTASPDGALAERLCAIHHGLVAVLAEHAPHEAAVEETFSNANPATTLKLGQARGIALLVPALAGLRVAEYAANLVKKSIVGAGHAEKHQIRHMIEVLLPRATIDGEDAADALAIAITHAHHRNAASLRAVR